MRYATPRVLKEINPKILCLYLMRLDLEDDPPCELQMVVVHKCSSIKLLQPTRL